MERYGRSSALPHTSAMSIRSERTHFPFVSTSDRRSLHVGFLRLKDRFDVSFDPSRAGVGRTGTFIALDAMIEKIKREGSINVWDFVRQTRTERHFMVQTVVSAGSTRRKDICPSVCRSNTLSSIVLFWNFISSVELVSDKNRFDRSTRNGRRINLFISLSNIRFDLLY